jgi:hypothetical protein
MSPNLEDSFSDVEGEDHSALWHLLIISFLSRKRNGKMVHFAAAVLAIASLASSVDGALHLVSIGTVINNAVAS